MIEQFIARWKAKRRNRFRCAKTGHFVTPEYAADNPDTTIKERC